ncbi:cupin domain-containing protein [Inquilinus limosus]|uniref:Transcriptional regulator n=1 Tax=Inquilinus limosus TaxID=171674 RepID=A0A211ZR39_9PROT|nr:cupin domain-containing protein [Inquilinus limosus]OWJ67741.1 transcriptional regulator [Inquilinus limosus]
MSKTAADIVDFAAARSEDTTYRPDPAKVLAGDPVQTVRNFYDDPSGQFSSGIWEGAIGAWRVTYTEEEFCHLLSGTVELADESGGIRRFEAGASFVIPAGFTGTWANVTSARKLYVIYERKG